MSAPDRRAMVERSGEELSVRRQCALVGVARSGVYRPKPVAGADDLAVMRRIDELHLELPFYGSRRMTFELNEEGRGVNRKRVQRLMRVMGIEALVPRPGTSKAAPGHKIYPYLLRGLKIVEPNHVWAADVTYIPMACGFLYLVAIIDWASRAVLAWRLSNTNDVNWTPLVGPWVVGFKVQSRLPLSFKNQAASCCFCLCCGYVGNAFALSKRSGISTALAAASILSMPARHTAIGVWLFIAW